MIFWRADTKAVTRAITDRQGGVSQGRYAGLNLGDHVGDRMVAVARNRQLASRELDLPATEAQQPRATAGLVFMKQCHGSDVAVVDAVPDAPPAADALVTDRPYLALVALVADCTPVLLADEAAGVVAAVHAGRAGMLAGVVVRTIEAMRDLGGRAIDAVVGPSICGRCYEVPAEMRETVGQIRPEAVALSWTGTPAIDVAGGVVAQLAELEVPVTWVPGCAREDASLYSHRRDGTTGRFGGVVVRRPS